jgi:hypothetical protein
VSSKYQIQEINGKKYVVNKYYLGQWVCETCNYVLLDYDDDTCNSKKDACNHILYQDWLVKKGVCLNEK